MTARRSLVLFLIAVSPFGGELAAQGQQTGMNSITADDLRMHLSFIAADESQGRDTPSTAGNMISSYLAAAAEHFGLKPVMPDGSFFQRIPLDVTEVSQSRSRLRVISQTGDELFYYPRSFCGSFRAAGAWDGEAVFVGLGLSEPDKGWDDYGELDLLDKAVIMLEGQLPEGHTLHSDRALLSTRVAALRAKGAALILTVVSPEREKEMLERGGSFQAASSPAMLSTYPTQNQARIGASPQRREQAAERPQQKDPAAPRSRPSPRRPSSSPTVEIRHETAARILDLSETELEAMFASIASGQQPPKNVVDKRIELSVVTETRRDHSPNVLAALEGSDPALKSEYVIIGAHYDHVGIRHGRIMNGADDNGSGTAALLEIAQALSLEGPKRSVLLAWFTAEEKGLWGSHYFVNHCPLPLENLTVNLNLDMISRNDPDSLFLIASNHLSTELDQAIRRQNDKYFKFKFDYVYSDRAHPKRFYYRSDHYPFLRVGVPAVWLFCGVTPDYHTPNDTVERVDFRKMEKVTRLTYLAACDIGNKPALLKLDANPEVKTRGIHNTSVESIR